MSIVSLEFSDSSWQLNETHFSALNVLVGVSGTGKTRTLNALRMLRRVGLKGARNVPSFFWKMQFSIEGHSYQWKGEIQSKSEETIWSDRSHWNDEKQNENAIFLNEYIKKDGVMLVERDHSTGVFLFKDAVLPTLKWTESAITLLADESDLKPLQNTLQCIVSSDESPMWYFSFSPFPHFIGESLSELQSATQLPLVVRAKELQDRYSDRFNEIKSDFIDTFPFVEDVRIVSVQEYFPQKKNTPFDIWTIAVKERDVQEWIAGNDLSTGMLRTLKLFLELALVPKGTLFLIDEFENSLGINCLPQVADIVNRRQGDIQFILTSHHPYVINNIPWTAWKLVTRQGSVVTIRNASEIPALQTSSSLDRFYLLINTPEYQEGIL
ncbi:ATPase AAA-type core domain-containing protein [uncultured Gammaproteobacteria bacterium]